MQTKLNVAQLIVPALDTLEAITTAEYYNALTSRMAIGAIDEAIEALNSVREKLYAEWANGLTKSEGT